MKLAHADVALVATKPTTKVTQGGQSAEPSRRQSKKLHILQQAGQPQQLNIYGDTKLAASRGRYGHDIASQRFDELDQACIRYALSCLEAGRKHNRAIDLGCGEGINGVRLGLMGFETVIYDIENMPDLIEKVQKLYPLCNIKKIKVDLATINTRFFPSNIDICYSQRFIHYLRYHQALELLEKIFANMRIGGRLFISASGLTSEIGQAHPERNVPVNERFAKVDVAIAQKHDIHAPICPYSAQELVDLCRRAGFLLIAADSSDFGNVKAIFEKATIHKD